MSIPLIQIKNISKIYHAKNRIVYALNNISLTIYAGEIISLLGVNGAGKTTLSSIVATLHPPTSGELLYEGASIYSDIVHYRQAMGFCPQKPNLDPYLNVEENLIFAGRYFLMAEEVLQQRVDALIKKFNLEPYRKFSIEALSGGYKQRVLIARAIVHNPKILILDEPTVALDPDIRRNLWNIIRDLKQQGMTIILTTHYLEEAELLSDRVCILSNGRIILTESVEGLRNQHEKQKLEDIFLKLLAQEERQALKP
ncbi:MAG: ABC transporter ATP-binding protein [Candidatus Babeliales bacterium]